MLAYYNNIIIIMSQLNNVSSLERLEVIEVSVVLDLPVCRTENLYNSDISYM